MITEIATKDDIQHLDRELGSFNQAKLSYNGQPEHRIAYIIKKNGAIIAGISACIDWGYVLHIELLFVEEHYRSQKLGSALLNKVEEEAKNYGAGLAQTDTFEFQAPNFYLKHGYEIFGVVENSPRPPYRRYYLKKSL